MASDYFERRRRELLAAGYSLTRAASPAARPGDRELALVTRADGLYRRAASQQKLQRAEVRYMTSDLFPVAEARASSAAGYRTWPATC